MRSSDGSSDVCASDLELVDDGDLTPYQPTDGFVYTRNDGTEFTIDAAGDVEKIVDPNGNTITITDDGINHSAGASVEFERDALGRIVAVTDPAGECQTYTYDARGAPVAHTDRDGHKLEEAQGGKEGGGK